MSLVNSDSQVVYFRSEHPIALEWIRELLMSDPALQGRVKPYSRTITAQIQSPALLILDCCSINDWPEIAIRWQRGGGSIVCIVSPETANYREQLRALYLGVCGLIPVSPNIRKELLTAVHSVLQGKLWYSRSALGQYLRMGQFAPRKSDAVPHKLTLREDQVISFVERKFSNKQIADALGISERTVKYHVSNILRKSQVSNRRELLKSSVIEHGFPTAM